MQPNYHMDTARFFALASDRLGMVTMMPLKGRQRGFVAVSGISNRRVISLGPSDDDYTKSIVVAPTNIYGVVGVT
jgi:hypothetical protein